jgi:uncharacterized protein (TIGR04255 family)
VTDGVLGSVEKFQTAIQGWTEYGQYSFRYSLKNPDETNKLDKAEYTLDFDYFKENVELDTVEEMIQNFHDLNFSLFYWCLGEKAKAQLGEGKAKK